MEEIEKKLAEYRAKKERQEKLEQLKTKSKKLLSKLWKNDGSKKDEKVSEPLVPSDDQKEVADSPSEDVPTVCDDDETINCCTWVDMFFYLLWFILWMILYLLFIEIQFGTVYLVSSGLIFIYFNTRTRSKRSDEVSAYSVFNKNCESIDGTLKAEQFERELRYGQL